MQGFKHLCSATQDWPITVLAISDDVAGFDTRILTKKLAAWLYRSGSCQRAAKAGVRTLPCETHGLPPVPGFTLGIVTCEAVVLSISANTTSHDASLQDAVDHLVRNRTGRPAVIPLVKSSHDTAEPDRRTRTLTA